MKRSEFQKLAASGIILDGATGTELAKHGMPVGVCPELWVYENPDSIRSVHRAYYEAGSRILYSPTFCGNRCKLAEFGLADRTAEINRGLARIAKENLPDAFIFGDIAPTGRFVEPYGDLPFEEAVAVYREQAQALLEGGVDGFVIETMMDLQEARAAYLGVREAAPDHPVMVTMTFEASGRSLTGVHPVAALTALQALGVDAFGCNCSTGPEAMAEIVASLKPYARIPLIAKPNAGLPHLEGNRTVFPMNPEEFAANASLLHRAGASLFGGCCGTTPEHIAALTQAVERLGAPETEKNPVCGVVSSVSSFRVLAPEQPFAVIGERINPTGKKALQAELREGKTDLVYEFAVQQQEAGAAVLDVNMGLSGINEAEMMEKSLKRLLHCTTLPLCIDSTDPATVERALRLYPGRALLNSISAESSRIRNVLPVAAKYGAMLILLPLTDSGIPVTAAERIEVVRRLLDEVKKYGYGPADVCVDALIMTVSTNPEAARVSLDLISWCRSQGLNTVCGLSNVSFGLPSRPLLNRTFLGMAIGCGLNMAIANPLFPELMELTLASDALAGRDAHQLAYLAKFSGAAPEKSTQSKAALTPTEKLYRAVMRGDAEGTPGAVDAVLAEGKTAQEILNTILIPAITEVGEKYEKKEYFLPQLILSADAMQAGTKHLEAALAGSPDSAPKARMIFATVKGDIHDIGKNIVIAILRNYGFDVLDLGKDVPAETILDTAVRENISVIGLSALMTTTMNAMRDTVMLAKKRGLDHLHFMVGGAVVDQAFADEIGATYTRTPMDTVRAGRKFAGLD